MSDLSIPCSIIRGGTSKGIFVLDAALPEDRGERDRRIMRLFGSPDARQIDGLGGADPLTSKLALVSASSRPGIDVEYEHVQVGVAEPTVNYSIMCGNLASAVGYFAVQEGLVSVEAPSVRLRIFCRNNGKLITAEVPVDEDGPVSTGETRIDGVPGCGARVSLTFHEPAGSMTGALLPLGEPRAALELANGPGLTVAVVDSGALYAFLDAADFGVSGHETAGELDQNRMFRERIERVRSAVADAVSRRGAKALSPKDVKVCILARPTTGPAEEGSPQTLEVVARVVNKERTHKAFPVGGAVALASAAILPGALGDASAALSESPALVLIHHPAGTFPAKVSFRSDGRNSVVEAVEIERTARVLMRGTAFLGPSE